MRYKSSLFSTLTLCLFAFNAHAQQNELEQLLSFQNISVSEIPDICSLGIFSNEPCINEGLAFQLSAEKATQNSLEGIPSFQLDAKTRAAKKVQKTHANSVVINVSNGYTFHVADYYGYYGNSRVVTCLNGAMKGHQGIADNGIVLAESNDVTWHKGYFVHRYPNGKITSYPNSQTAEIEIR